MELSEKIQTLRKERALTQEQLAEMLFVSRTAVSKWETGRGTPNIESLQAMAKIFGVTLDALLSTEEMVVVAENEQKEAVQRLFAYWEGACNLAAVLGLVLPIYKLAQQDAFYAVPLYQLAPGWQSVLFAIAIIGMSLCGLVQLLSRQQETHKWENFISLLAMGCHFGAIFIFILSSQPYPALLFFLLFVIKGVLEKKKP